MRGQKAFAPVDVAVDAELFQPFAALLVEGATLAHPDDSILEWRASLLFPRPAHVYEIERADDAHHGPHSPGCPPCWTRCSSATDHKNSSRPSAGSYGSRCRSRWAGTCASAAPSGDTTRLLWHEGFTPLPDATARLATGHVVDAAAPGVTPAGADEPTATGVPVESLLTDALLDLLRAGKKVQLAAVGRTLFVLVAGVRAFDNRSNVAKFDTEYGRKTAQRVARVEAIAREVVRAGAARASDGGRGGRARRALRATGTRRGRARARHERQRPAAGGLAGCTLGCLPTTCWARPRRSEVGD